ncbi:chymotrypsin inhibitor-like [Culex quinquefasciatus]|uniref:chymotrypsin inhibitor-like n=1 Tax=Culex quinquefasciatus TaxID=7176 RepID=UPI0018E34911|nr:chymotrypsin inhibitor-like [Culex quinquefasciatus]XP_039449461.1 chymotrypsin inhibitor-like [Culex pipiens pallens]
MSSLTTVLAVTFFLSSSLVLSVPSDFCGINEVFRFCGPIIQPSCASQRIGSKVRIPGCKMGCTCKPTFVRNAFGICVQPSKCFLSKAGNSIHDSIKNN